MHHVRDGIRTGFSLSNEILQCAADLHAALQQPCLRLVILFLRPDMDLPALAAALSTLFGSDVPVIGCTTAGEITPEGFTSGAVSGVSLSADTFAAAVVPVWDLHACTVANSQELVRPALQDLARQAPTLRRDQMFAFTLIDGLSNCEETVVSALHGALGEVPLFGGSAGDNLRFERTHILYAGAVHSDIALLVVIGTTLPFRVFKTEHFIAGDEKMVVTEADPDRRMVSEINAEPAAQEYARIIGLGNVDLTPMVFATHPVVVRIGGQNFVRSIQKVNPDNSLTFFCAIDQGIVLTIAQGVDLAQNLADLFDRVQHEIGTPALTLGFDCIFRSLEIRDHELRPTIDGMMAANRVVGFSTYGEQFHAMHVNQTFTGVSIGMSNAVRPPSLSHEAHRGP